MCFLRCRYENDLFNIINKKYMEKYSFEQAQKEAEEIRKKTLKTRKEESQISEPANRDYEIAERCLPGELAKFRLPEIYKVPFSDKETRPAVIYDASKLSQELRQQRINLADDQKNTPLSADICNKFTRIRSLINASSHMKTQVQAIEEIPEKEPDYLETEDHTEFYIFSKDADKLAQDITGYFKSKLTFIATKEHLIEGKPNNNVSEKLIGILKDSLSIIKGKGEIDHRLEVMNQKNRIDISFSIYPGIEHQIIIRPTENLGDDENKDKKKGFPFLDTKNMKYYKRLHFHKSKSTKGNRSIGCDLLTQLDLLEYLKTNGHVATLPLGYGRNYDFPNKHHYSFAI